MPYAKKLGSNLEWHGNKIRVVVGVPRALHKVLGSKLRETLDTSDPRKANALKWPVIARLKGKIAEAVEEAEVLAGKPRNDAIREGLFWRHAYAEEARQLDEQPDGAPGVGDLVRQRHREIAIELGPDEADLFVEVAVGRQNPLTALVDAWVREQGYAPRTEAGFRHSVKALERWCEGERLPATVEAINPRVAGRFVTEVFLNKGSAPATTNKAVTALKAYWRWLAKRGHIQKSGDGNPWEGQGVQDRARDRRRAAREPGEIDKRPFTNDEVSTLLGGIADQPLADFIRVAALTGMRRDEVATLRVRHVQGGVIAVPGTKTFAAARKVPVHPDLAVIVASRSAGKTPDAFLFDELPEQKNPARGRGGPISQAFTRKRRDLGVDDTPEGARQSRVDLHSLRRWFIRRAVEALEGGAKGFTAWTIADVVGHSKEDGPLAMTMGRYPGAADVTALRACVEAVTLPSPALIQIERKRRGRPPALPRIAAE